MQSVGEVIACVFRLLFYAVSIAVGFAALTSFVYALSALL